jgi:hypothetical protein
MEAFKVIVLCILLAGCTTTTGLAKPAEMPALPVSLAQKARRLPPVTDPTLTGQTLSAVDTDRLYNGVAERYNILIDAWECVRLALRDKQEMTTCLTPSK